MSFQRTLKDDLEEYHHRLGIAEKRMFAGKGLERHGHGKNLDDQVIRLIPRMLGFLVGLGFLLGQAIKKIVECINLPPARAILELSDAINYLQDAIYQFQKLEKKIADSSDNKPSCSGAPRPGAGA